MRQYRDPGKLLGMKILDELPKADRVSLKHDLVVGGTLTHKKSGREWTITKHWRSDQTLQVTGPGVDSPMTLTYADVRREWKIVHSK